MYSTLCWEAAGYSTYRTVVNLGACADDLEILLASKETKTNSFPERTEIIPQKWFVKIVLKVDEA